MGGLNLKMLSIINDYAEDLSSLLELDGEMAQFQYLIDIGQKIPNFEESDRIRQYEWSYSKRIKRSGYSYS